MRLTTTKLDVVARTAPIPLHTLPLLRLTADGVHGPCRLQAHVYYGAAHGTWTVQRYAFRLTGGPVRRGNAVGVKLVSDGAVEHAFVRPGDTVNDGRWYVHDHASEVSRSALTYVRFEAWFEIPGVARRAWDDLWDPPAGGRLRGPRDRDPRARVGPRPGHAQDVERAAERA